MTNSTTPADAPLTQARRDRDAIERFWQMRSGLPADLFHYGALPVERAGRARAGSAGDESGGGVCRATDMRTQFVSPDITAVA